MSQHKDRRQFGSPVIAKRQHIDTNRMAAPGIQSLRGLLVAAVSAKASSIGEQFASQPERLARELSLVTHGSTHEQGAIVRQVDSLSAVLAMINALPKFTWAGQIDEFTFAIEAELPSSGGMHASKAHATVKELAASHLAQHIRVWVDVGAKDTMFRSESLYPRRTNKVTFYVEITPQGGVELAAWLPGNCLEALPEPSATDLSEHVVELRANFKRRPTVFRLTPKKVIPVNQLAELVISLGRERVAELERQEVAKAAPAVVVQAPAQSDAPVVRSEQTIVTEAGTTPAADSSAEGEVLPEGATAQA